MKTLFDPEIYESFMNYWKLVDGVVWYRPKWHSSSWRVETGYSDSHFHEFIRTGALREVADEVHH